MTFLCTYKRNGSTVETYVQAANESEAREKVESRSEGSLKNLSVEQVYVAITRNARMSAFKGRPLARSCRGLAATKALELVEFSPKKAAEILKKTLLSAIANARHNGNVEKPGELKVHMCVFDESVRMRRYWPTARGSAHPIARRLCHCKVVLAGNKKEAK